MSITIILTISVLLIAISYTFFRILKDIYINPEDFTNLDLDETDLL